MRVEVSSGVTHLPRNSEIHYQRLDPVAGSSSWSTATILSCKERGDQDVHHDVGEDSRLLHRSVSTDTGSIRRKHYTDTVELDRSPSIAGLGIAGRGKRGRHIVVS